MKKFILSTLFFGALSLSGINAQCPLTCTGAGADITGTPIAESGNPCVVTYQWVYGGTNLGFLGEGDVILTNATCTNCPNFLNGQTTNWTITATGPCASAGATISWVAFGFCNNSSTCPVTGGILPVELIDFRATLTDNSTSLFWKTATEINNEGFQIERSNDGPNWEVLDFVNGHGTSQQTQAYTFIDEKPLANLNYYRLKQMDFDGAYEYSKVVSVHIKKGDNIAVYPNPSTGKFTISGIDIQNAKVSIYNTVGQLVKEEILTQSVLDISDLVDGLYYLMVRQGDVVKEVRVVKE